MAVEPSSAAPLFSNSICPKADRAYAISLGCSLSGGKQNKVSEAFNYHGCDLGQVGTAALHALVHELIELAVQALAHPAPLFH